MINVLRYRWITAAFSLVIIVSFAGTALYKWQKDGQVFNYSVDFTGGAQVLLSFEKPVSALQLKEILESAGWEGVNTREFAENEVLIRVKESENDSVGTAARIEQLIQERLPDNRASILSSDIVGPGVGSTLKYKSIQAIVIGLILMLLYIALRFWSIGFAVGAVIALFHDALVMLAALLFFNREISLNVISAILAVLGYSINDTIVIFSQIRDNLRSMPGKPLSELVNLSINQTLRRTMLTSISTGLTVLSMLILGGEVLRDFSFTLLIGIVFGTYSSIYIASPIMMLFSKKD